MSDAGPNETVMLNNATTMLGGVHPREACEGEACCIHNPSDHHMREWPMHWRDDRRLMERICPHGVGHPDPDDLAFHVAHGRDWQGVHGCDGCCVAQEPASSRVGPNGGAK